MLTRSFLSWIVVVLTPTALAEPRFSFADISLASDFRTVAKRYPHSTPQDQYILLAPEDSHDHISAIEISGTGRGRRVRVAFETWPNGRDKRPDYPACTQVEATLVKQFGQPNTVRRFFEEASRRADRVWQSAAEEMILICFEGPRRRLFAEAVQITPR